MGMAQERGRAGEALAAAYLELAGCTVLARNRKLAGVEVDLVVADGRCRVVVEVKLRTRGDYGGPALAVDRGKQQRLARAARALADAEEGPVRVDVIAVELADDGARLLHYRNAVTD
ncbi:MAG: YraN family protein [Candidatus Eisenbacteria bacterium]|nr:YraN family protein [Candidatus Eisenbacteria bacterium]